MFLEFIYHVKIAQLLLTYQTISLVEWRKGEEEEKGGRQRGKRKRKRESEQGGDGGAPAAGEGTLL